LTYELFVADVSTHATVSKSVLNSVRHCWLLVLFHMDLKLQML